MPPCRYPAWVRGANCANNCYPSGYLYRPIHYKQPLGKGQYNFRRHYLDTYGSRFNECLHDKKQFTAAGLHNHGVGDYVWFHDPDQLNFLSPY